MITCRVPQTLQSDSAAGKITIIDNDVVVDQASKYET